jgi:hypothetical protein
MNVRGGHLHSTWCTAAVKGCCLAVIILGSCVPDASQGPTVQPVQAAGPMPAAPSQMQGHFGWGQVQHPQ